MTEHSYTVHLQVTATSDSHAQRVAEFIRRMVEEVGDRPGPMIRSEAGYIVDACHLTDADDWSEHATIGGEAICGNCGRDVDRQRVGNGARMCTTCINTLGATTAYPIADVRI